MWLAEPRWAGHRSRRSRRKNAAARLQTRDERGERKRCHPERSLKQSQRISSNPIQTRDERGSRRKHALRASLGGGRAVALSRKLASSFPRPFNLARKISIKKCSREFEPLRASIPAAFRRENGLRPLDERRERPKASGFRHQVARGARFLVEVTRSARKKAPVALLPCRCEANV